MHRGQSFSHEHTLPPPTRRQPHLTEHHSRPPPLAVIGQCHASDVGDEFSHRNLGRAWLRERSPDFSSMSVGLLVMSACHHARPASSMPRHVAVVSDCESLHGRDEVSKRADHSSSGPRVRPRVSWSDREGCPHGDKYVRLEMRVHLRISQSNLDGDAFFFLTSPTCRPLHAFWAVSSISCLYPVLYAMLYAIFPTRRHCPALHPWELRTLSLGTVTGGSCSQM